MTDIKSATNPLFLREEELRQCIELLFFAYRDFTAGPDQILKDYGFGRAHHRVIHFVGRNPGITVSELLDILRITKQSLSRVLNALVERGFVEQKPGATDRRQRLLYLTADGKKLEHKISRVQQEQVAQAFRDAGGDAVAGYRKVLEGLINEDDRDIALKRIMGQ
ncbi:MarR family transcriptional regulator [Sneathiella sp. P13V-1]|uniref:MarR family winged helix-turn-helix transcriptional regulator n=1 Tax=Sneathiella sp. P13V-1 TaxID=2697366 RepID=UPI00187B9FA3|nr:MarR family transcriptional regulator [Sneathiella sp. P13V-1]MBE7638063.1 MarR family transcriptional regulator [Sneathiella sp. P13V-1]